MNSWLGIGGHWLWDTWHLQRWEAAPQIQTWSLFPHRKIQHTPLLCTQSSNSYNFSCLWLFNVFLPCGTTYFFLVFRAFLISWKLRTVHFYFLNSQSYIPPPQALTFQSSGPHLSFSPSICLTHIPTCSSKTHFIILYTFFLPKLYIENLYYYLPSFFILNSSSIFS